MMKKIILLFFITLAGLALTYSCSPRENFYDNIQSLIAAEQSFARVSSDSGIRKAFMTFLAEDAIVFRPEPVKGKSQYANSPEVPGMLIWQPYFADISRDGKLGYTTGPWEYRQETKSDSAEGYGDYISIWEKQPDDSWQVMVDIGISHPHPGYNLRNALMETEYPRIDLSQKKQKKSETNPTILLELDRSFSIQSEGLGIQKAFQSHASPEIRLYRESFCPMVGLEYSLTYLSDFTGTFRWTPLSGDIASSADLGYTYGTGEYRTELADSVTVERFSYLRIWKIDNEGNWKMVLETIIPMPSAETSS